MLIIVQYLTRCITTVKYVHVFCRIFAYCTAPSHNKAYALHSLAVVRATPNRGGKAAATSHKQNVTCNPKRQNRNLKMNIQNDNTFDNYNLCFTDTCLRF